MTEPFYSGGFLYIPTSKKILLHKRDDKTKNNPNSWAFFGGLSIKKERPIDTFLREINEELGLQLEPKVVKAFTDYFNPDLNTHRYVFFTEMKVESEFHLHEGDSYGWFTLLEAMHLTLTKRTRQDLQLFTQNSFSSPHFA